MTITSSPEVHGSEQADQPPQPAPDTPTEPATTGPELEQAADAVKAPAEHRAPRLRQLMARYNGPRDMDGQLRLATQLAKAKYALPWQYRDNPGDLVAIMQHALALDIQLSVAWDNIHFNEKGAGGIRARLMHALVLRAGHEIQLVHLDDKRCRMRLKRCDGKPGGGAQFTALEASQAGLFNRTGSPWTHWGQDMLWARCMSRLVRRWAPEVILGFYEVSEIDDDGGPDRDAVDPVDLSTAMTDVDGNLTPAPDVVELLKDVDVLTLAEIRKRMAQAHEEGLMGAYAGTIDGIAHTVGEILFDKGTEAEARETAARREASRATAAAMAAVATAGQPGDEPAGPAPASAEDAPAGTGEKLACGCNPAAVLADGNHEKGCGQHVAN